MATRLGDSVSVGDVMQRISSLICEGQEKDAAIEKLNEELKQKEQEIAILKERLHRKSGSGHGGNGNHIHKLQSSEERNRELSKKLDNQRIRIKSLEGKVENIQWANNTLYEDNDTLRKEKAKDKKIIKDLREQNKMGVQGYKEISQRFGHLKRKYSELEHKMEDISRTKVINKGMNQEISRLKALQKKTRSKYEANKDELSEAKKRIKALENALNLR